MSSLEARIVSTESDIRKQADEVRRLRAKSEEKESAWLTASGEAQWIAKASWSASREDLAAAREELSALRRREAILLEQQTTPGKVCADTCFQACLWSRCGPCQ